MTAEQFRTHTPFGTPRGASRRLAAMLAVGLVSISVGGAIIAAPSAAQAAEVFTLEREVTITPDSPSKTWRVPAGIVGGIDFVVSGEPGHATSSTGAGAGAKLSFSTIRAAGEELTVVFGARNREEYASLGGGAGSGLPPEFVAGLRMYQFPYLAKNASSAGGGNATAVLIGPAGDRCDGDAEVLAVAAGGGGAGGRTVGKVANMPIIPFNSFSGDPGKDATELTRSVRVTASVLCRTPNTNSAGADGRGETLLFHAAGGGGGGGLTAGNGGGPDQASLRGLIVRDVVPAGGGAGGASYISPSVCGDCAAQTVTPTTAVSSTTIRWHEKHTPVMTAAQKDNLLLVEVVSAQTGQPLSGTITLRRPDGTVVVSGVQGAGRWELDASAPAGSAQDVAVEFVPDSDAAMPGRILTTLANAPVEPVSAPADPTTVAIEIPRASQPSAVDGAMTVPIGEPVQLAALVSGSAGQGVGGGIVEFRDDDVLLGFAPVEDGRATLELDGLDGMSNRIEASYLGVPGVTTASESDPVTLAYASADVRIAVDPGPAEFVADSDGEAIITVSAPSGSTVPAGDLSLRAADGQELLRFADAEAEQLPDGTMQWRYPLSMLTSGDHDLFASFDGDPGFADARSEEWSNRVTPRATLLSGQVASRDNASVVLDVAATVDGSGKDPQLPSGVPLGSVKVFQGDVDVASSDVDGSGSITIARDALRGEGDLRVEFAPDNADLAPSAMTVPLRGQLAATGVAPATGAAAALGLLALIVGAACVVASDRRMLTVTTTVVARIGRSGGGDDAPSRGGIEAGEGPRLTSRSQPVVTLRSERIFKHGHES